VTASYPPDIALSVLYRRLGSLDRHNIVCPVSPAQITWQTQYCLSCIAGSDHLTDAILSVLYRRLRSLDRHIIVCPVSPAQITWQTHYCLSWIAGSVDRQGWFFRRQQEKAMCCLCGLPVVRLHMIYIMGTNCWHLPAQWHFQKCDIADGCHFMSCTFYFSLFWDQPRTIKQTHKMTLHLLLDINNFEYAV